MNRLTTITRLIADTAHDIVERVPQLGSDFAFEPGVGASGSASPEPIVRNRWTRNDLISAIGHDPHDADSVAITWPPLASRC